MVVLMLPSFMASENFALILAVGSTPVGWGVGGVVSAGVGGTVLTTVGAPGAAQAIPAARSSATGIVFVALTPTASALRLLLVPS